MLPGCSLLGGAPGTQPGKMQMAEFLQGWLVADKHEESPLQHGQAAPFWGGLLAPSLAHHKYMPEITWSAGVKVSVAPVGCKQARVDAVLGSLREIREGPSQARAWALKFSNACEPTDMVVRWCALVPPLRLLRGC